MKITVEAKNLAAAIAKASSVIKPKVAIPVLECVKIEFSGTNATVSASDLGQSAVVSLTLLGADSNAGAFLVPGKRLQEILANSTAAQVTIEQTTECAVAKLGKFTANLRVSTPAGFPVLPTPTPAAFEIKLAAVKALIERVEAVVPTKDGRYAQTVIRLARTGTTLEAVATDGYRIAIASIITDAGKDFTLLLTKDVLPILKDMSGETVNVSESDNNFFYSTPTMYVLTTKPSQKFPDFARAFQLPFKTKLTLNADDLKSGIARCRATTEAESAQIVFTIKTASELLLSATDDKIGTSDDSIVAKLEGEPNLTRMAPSYVLDFLSKATGEITLQVVDEKNLALFSNGDSFKTFIMGQRDATLKEEKKAA